MRVTSLHIYPVKALGAVDVSASAVEPRGLAHDRRWMLVDAEGKFITQREHPKLARLKAAVTPEGLRITSDTEHIEVRRPTDAAPRLPVVLWKQGIEGHASDAAADAWFSAYLGLPCRLVYQGALQRPIANQWAPPGTIASYADGYPLLIVTEASLEDLNKRMGKRLPMNRFRPNVVVSGALPWAEDSWKTLRLGSVTVAAVKPCTRCVVTTTDQHSGARENNEPLDTLKKFRLLRQPGLTGVVFGQNAVPFAAGHISVGDSVEVLETREAPAFSGVG
jgi:uncharacterized protein YcbX